MEVFHLNFALGLFEDFVEKCKSIVVDVVVDEVVQGVQFDTNEELNKLEEKLSFAESLLDSFQPTSDNNWQHWQRWVEKVTGVSYDAQDLVDDITLDSSKISSVPAKILSLFSRPSIGRKIQGLQDKLEQTIKELDMVNRTNQQTQQHSLGYHKDFVVERDQVLHPEKVFGREEDKTAIIAMLLEGEKKIISIVGMDGLGKTSLAQYVLDDSRIRNKFHEIVWVSVNDRFNHGEMIDILDRRLQGEYARSNVLIVLDDLWEVNHTEWRLFRSRFPNPSGCKVLLTTNNWKVAKVTESVQYYLDMVKDEDCETLIKDKALLSNHTSEHLCKRLKDIAQPMAEKCKGLPVVANVLGSFLSYKLADESNEEWRTYPLKCISELGVLEEYFFPPSRLNYLCLELHLKKCLAYCALFPLKYKFKKDDLVQLWMAEGFLRPQRSTSVEQVGYEYFDELSSRSVFHRSGLHEDRPFYEMHEIIHKLVESMASYTCCQLKKVESFSSIPSFRTARHLSLICGTITLSLLEEIEKCDGLRTLLFLSKPVTEVGQVPYSLFQRLRRLKVLDLSYTDIQMLPDSLVRLTNLRYLDASQTNIVRLPESVSKLHRLQVLKLRGCTRFRELPKNLKNLTNLIHLEVNMKGLRYRPRSIGSLSYLRTLPFFRVGKDEGCRITELQNLNFLCGKVCLADLENVNNDAEAKEAKIRDKASITRLELKWQSCSIDEFKVINILDSLQPHQNLEELQVINYGGSRFPAWLTSPSYKLVSIHMEKCLKVRVLPLLGQLPVLERLHIQGLDLVENVDYRFCGEWTTRAFPSLKSLTILKMKGLLMWSRLPEDSMPELQDLIVRGCPKLSSIGSLMHINTLQYLEINRCPELITLPELPVSIQRLIVGESDRLTQMFHHGGPQWCRIKDIPYFEIDGNRVNGDSI